MNSKIYWTQNNTTICFFSLNFVFLSLGMFAQKHINTKKAWWWYIQGKQMNSEAFSLLQLAQLNKNPFACAMKYFPLASFCCKLRF